MPISPSYVVQYLLESSRPGNESLGWYEKADGFGSRLQGLDLHLESIPNRAGPRVRLTISSLPERVYIWEPPRSGLFPAKYKSEEEERLASLLRDLITVAAQQCSQRENRPQERADRIREAIFRQLIGVAETAPTTYE